jgi:hypothetical protein
MIVILSLFGNDVNIYVLYGAHFSMVDFLAKKWNAAQLIGNPLFIIMKKRCNTRDDKETITWTD